MKKRVKAKELKPLLPIPPALFESILVFLLSDHCSRQLVTKLSGLFESVNTTVYSEDGDLEIYFRVIARILSFHLDDGLNDNNLIASRLIESPKDGEEISELFEKLNPALEKFDNVKAVYVENEIISRINFLAVGPLAGQLKLAISKFENQDYESYSEAVKLIQTNSAAVNKSIIAKSSTSLSIPDVKFSNDDSFFGAIDKTRKFMNDDKRVIKTGSRRLNKFLNGGFAPGRVYLFNAISGGWKSGLLLNVIIWACKYNLDVRCNDLTKRPCAVYLTQENDVQETIERLISYVGGVLENGKAMSTEEIAEKFVSNRIRGGRWDIEIIYRPKNSISTGDLDGIISEIEAEGEVEVKILVHDYVKRIKPEMPTGDLRIDLGEVCNDLSVLAKARKIPVVDANQLNRAAYQVLEEVANNPKGEATKKMDQGMRLDASMISESQMMLENVDFACGLHREMAQNGMFLAFKKFKDRADKSNNISGNYFAHPFEPNNSMRLIEDIELDASVSIDKISDIFGSTVVYDPEDDEDDEPTPSKPVPKGNGKSPAVRGGKVIKSPTAEPTPRVDGFARTTIDDELA